jgi:hypothetical protein
MPSTSFWQHSSAKSVQEFSAARVHPPPRSADRRRRSRGTRIDAGTGSSWSFAEQESDAAEVYLDRMASGQEPLRLALRLDPGSDPFFKQDADFFAAAPGDAHRRSYSYISPPTSPTQTPPPHGTLDVAPIPERRGAPCRTVQPPTSAPSRPAAPHVALARFPRRRASSPSLPHDAIFPTHGPPWRAGVQPLSALSRNDFGRANLCAKWRTGSASLCR